MGASNGVVASGGRLQGAQVTGKVTSAEEYAEARAAMVRLNLPCFLHDAETLMKLPGNLLAHIIAAITSAGVVLGDSLRLGACVIMVRISM